MDTQTKIDFVVNEEMQNSHPFKHYIMGLSEQQLLIRRPYVVSAVNAWRENQYNETKDRQDYNIQYFESELNIIDTQLAKLKKIKK